MSHGKSDQDQIQNDKSTARFCVENRQISWVLFVATILWGVYGYYMMPKRKDPQFKINRAAVVCPWPGISATKIEQQVTKRLEAAIGTNVTVEKVESLTRSNISIVYIILDETEPDTAKQWDDIQLKLNAINDLPEGAGPITFLRDFGDTAALMLTVSSPKADQGEISWRETHIRKAIQDVRANKTGGARSTAFVCFPVSVNPIVPRQNREQFIRYVLDKKQGRNLVPIEGPGFVGVDGEFFGNEAAVQALMREFFTERLRPSEQHPDTWPPVVVSDPAQTGTRLAASTGDKYSLKQLDEFSELVQRTLQAIPIVAKATRSGVLREQTYLEYSQERLASSGLQPSSLPQLLSGRNAILPGGLLEVGGKNILISPTGEFRDEKELGSLVLGATPRGSAVYLRDAVDIYRAYEPPLYLNYYMTKDAKGNWSRNRAITLSVFMREGRQIVDFGLAVDGALASLKGRLPEDVLLSRTSDQPLQVQEIVSLFMQALGEAVVLVVLLALIGFWEWRSAMLMAIAIPLTLAMTFGMMRLLNIDLQQVSIASLIIALGLLVDDPVVAIDAIKRELDSGHSKLIAAWLGPQKLATAILFATITNIVAYLPMLLIQGTTGDFMYSLPIVMACSLVASRIVSMTFVPLLGYYLLKPSSKPAEPMSVRRNHGFAKLYYSFAGTLINYRKSVLAFSLVLLGAGFFYVKDLKQVFFPNDLSYLSFADIWLPEDASLAATEQAAKLAGEIIVKTAEEYGKHHAHDPKQPQVLNSLTTFVGGGGPRFWFSVAPEILQQNYAQIIIQVHNKHDTADLSVPLQAALSAGVPGALIDVRQLETSSPIGVPVQVRISGEDETMLRAYGSKVEDILRSIPEAVRVRNNWGTQAFSMQLNVDAEKANLYGLTNRDVAISSGGGMTGLQVSSLRPGDDQIPIVTRLRTGQRAQLWDVENLYVYSFNSTQKLPLSEVSTVKREVQAEKIQRRNQFRTLTVLCFPTPGHYPADVMDKAKPLLAKFAATLPPGYSLQIGGEEEERLKGFGQVVLVLIVSTAMIFLALVFQFHSAVKPFIVFAAIPFGMIGALIALKIMDTPFGFIAFLGIVSLIGVIVSHVIVLFDFIEEAHAEGEPFRDALLAAGILRLRPVLITVGATVIALVPLAQHGGPLWEPLCYTQIGGLLVATVVTLLLVPVLYAFFVLDLKIVKWDTPATHPEHNPH